MMKSTQLLIDCEFQSIFMLPKIGVAYLCLFLYNKFLKGV
jgi:hypothetical protein